MSDPFCPWCGHQCRATDRFCRACGLALSDEARADEPIAEAEALVSRGLLTDAIATVQRAIGAAGTPDLHVALATLYLRGGRATDAMRALEAALALDSAHAVAEAYIGGLWLQAGRVDEALEHLDRALALAPDDLIVRIKRAEYWLRLGVLGKARDDLRYGLQNGGGSPATRALAEAMFASVERKSRNAFVRNTVSLPSMPGWARLVRRGRRNAKAVAELEG